MRGEDGIRTRSFIIGVQPTVQRALPDFRTPFGLRADIRHLVTKKPEGFVPQSCQGMDTNGEYSGSDFIRPRMEERCDKRAIRHQPPSVGW